MNLKTKLIVTFAVVIAVPLFLISIVFVGFMSLQPAGGGDPADEGIFRGDADLGHLDHGYDLQLSDGMDLPEYFKSD